MASISAVFLVLAAALAVLHLELAQCQFMTSSRAQQLPKLGKRYVGGVFLIPRVRTPAQRVPWLYDTRPRPAILYNRMNPAGYRSFGMKPVVNDDDDDREGFQRERKGVLLWTLEK